ncbi:hypothetical protein RXV86_21960 [Alisedimentitalea sp. MJ-SS2]|uniref:RNA polymerase sigma factor n=1 Tax=Aliisedimentitalea sp. MJ-SS2 TaxID=3049795 RepID=UPI002908CA29|nr:hypothetical protein [Alisedimentitalea sp. MJ-SS2]MDU8930061.1 hypothetical protein [Alisedimentitalea sp. MJ-SS2]
MSTFKTPPRGVNQTCLAKPNAVFGLAGNNGIVQCANRPTMKSMVETGEESGAPSAHSTEFCVVSIVEDPGREQSDQMLTNRSLRESTLENMNRHNFSYSEWLTAAQAEHMAALLRYCRWRNLDEDDAAEAVIRTFEKFKKALINRRPFIIGLVLDYEPDSKNVYRVLRNSLRWRIADVIDEKENARRVEPGWAPEDASDQMLGFLEKEKDAVSEAADGEDNLDTLMSKELLRKATLKAIEDGKNKTGDLRGQALRVYTFHFKGLESNDIADMMDVTVQTVRNNLALARKAIVSAGIELMKDN